MLKVYLLQHSYEVDGCGCDETKTIGIYSSREIAELVVEDYKKRVGFQDYPDCFFIDEYAVDENHWSEGFIKYDEAIE